MNVESNWSLYLIAASGECIWVLYRYSGVKQFSTVEKYNFIYRVRHIVHNSQYIRWIIMNLTAEDKMQISHLYIIYVQV